MRTIGRTTATLLIVDVQTRLMPSIADAAAVQREIRRLLEAATLLDVPVIVTEQNPAGLGPTEPGLLPPALTPFPKMHFDACREPGFLDQLRGPVIVAGCEAHVCVLQTVLGLLDAGRPVYLARDAAASRTSANRDAAIARMAAHGAEIVTAEMVIFEWLATANHPRFRDAIRLVK